MRWFLALKDFDLLDADHVHLESFARFLVFALSQGKTDFFWEMMHFKDRSFYEKTLKQVLRNSMFSFNKALLQHFYEKIIESVNKKDQKLYIILDLVLDQSLEANCPEIVTDAYTKLNQFKSQTSLQALILEKAAQCIPYMNLKEYYNPVSKIRSKSQKQNIEFNPKKSQLINI